MRRPTAFTTVRLPLEDIRRCAADPRFRAAVAAAYTDLDEEITAHRPACQQRGACCKFGRFGHRLFVTPVELAYFTGAVAAVRGPSAGQDVCPFQQDGLCSVRTARPSGCRIFFCEPASRDWQPPRTERTLNRLKALHEQFGLPYAYVDWMDALRQLAGV